MGQDNDSEHCSESQGSRAMSLALDPARFEDLIGKAGTDVAQLAMLGSIAVRLEPQLVRLLRLRLLPGLPASLEADLWFSDLVHTRTAEGIILNPQVVDLLRSRLRADERLERAWSIVQEVHRTVSAVQKLEEEIAYVATARPGDRESLEGLMMRAVRAVEEGWEGAERWSRGALERLPSQAREGSTITLLRTVAKVKPVRGQTPHDALFESGVATTENRTRVKVLRRTDELVFNATEDEAASIVVPEADPIYLKVETHSMPPQKISLTAGRRLRIKVGNEEATITNAAGERFGVAGSNAPRKTKVFLSYSQQTAWFAEELTRNLALFSQAGVIAFLREADISMGVSIWSETMRMLEEADYLLTIRPAHANELMAREIQVAHSIGLPVITIIAPTEGPVSV